MEEQAKESYLGTAKISKLMLKFCIPCVLSLLVSALYNIVDQIFVGNSELSDLGNAATGVVFPIFIIAQGFAWWIGDGSAAYLNIQQGKKKTEYIHRCVGTGMIATLLISVILLAVFYPLKTQLLLLFGASENSIGYAVEYFNIILGFFPIYMLSNMINAVVRADGSPTWSMISMLSGAVVNIILDPIFIFVCHWGMKGAAWATVIGQGVSFAVSIAYLFRTKTFRLCLNSFVPKFKEFFEALKLGLSSFITQMTIVIISLVCNIMLKKYGGLSQYGEDIPIAIIAIESKVFTVVINIVVGIALGCQPIIGYNLGAEKYDRVKKLYRNIMLAVLGIAAAFTILFEAAPNACVAIFGAPKFSDPDLYWEFGRKTFRIFLMLVIFTCITKTSSIFFQAVGKPIFAVLLSVVRDLLVFVPLIILMPMALGIEGILWSSSIADALGFALTAALTIVFFNDLNKRAKLQKLQVEAEAPVDEPTETPVDKPTEAPAEESNQEAPSDTQPD